MIDSSRDRHGCQVDEVLVSILFLLHVSRGGSQQLFGGLAVGWKTRNAAAEGNADCLPRANRELVSSDGLADSLCHHF